MRGEDGYPWSEAMGSAEIDGKWVLTHAIWHPTLMHGFGNCPETGIHRLDAPRGERFSLVQHDWRNFAKAEAVIVRCLRKGRDADQISKLMDRIKSMRRLGRVQR